jgi:protein SCO1/2
MGEHPAVRRRHRTGRTVAALAFAGALALAACGSDDGSTDATTAPSDVTTDNSLDTSGGPAGGERELAGIVRDPAPVVDATAVPSLTNPGSDVVFRAEPGGFQAVYFGYTNCPDVCPTTMADWAVTMRRLPEDLAAQVSTVMVTVDPDRDNELLPGYIESFVADGEAAGTTDADVLAAATAPFGVSYDVTTNDEGDIEVSHSGFLYLVDDQGRLVVTWPFGTSSAEMAADVEQLFAEQGDA